MVVAETSIYCAYGVIRLVSKWKEAFLAEEWYLIVNKQKPN